MNAFFSVARMLLWPSLLIKGLWLVLFAISALFYVLAPKNTARPTCLPYVIGILYPATIDVTSL